MKAAQKAKSADEVTAAYDTATNSVLNGMGQLE
jgi:hypothetical protein